METKSQQTAAWVGGVFATLVLLAAGIAYIVIGVNGRSTVHDNVARENIVGSPDMTPAEIVKGAEEAGLKPDQYEVPDCSVAGDAVDTGSKAKCFADYMRVHALESSGGLVYADMGRFQLASNPEDPAGTSDAALAAKDDSGRPIPNGPRNTWVTQTALTTGLNMAFFAEQVSLFGIVVGITMIVIGVGLGVLTFYVLGAAPWRKPEATPSA